MLNAGVVDTPARRFLARQAGGITPKASPGGVSSVAGIAETAPPWNVYVLQLWLSIIKSKHFEIISYRLY